MKMNPLILTTALTVSLFVSQSANAQQAASAVKTPTNVVASPASGNFRDSVLSQLPPEKAKIYKDAIDQLRTKNKAIYDQIQKAQQDLSALVTADTFDKAAYLAKNDEIQKLYTQMHNNTAETIAGVASQFTLSERKTLEELHQSRQRPSAVAVPQAK